MRLATALLTLSPKLHHTASHGTKMNESLCCLESTEVTEEPCLWVSAKLGTEPGTEPQTDWFLQGALSRELRFAHTHTLPSFSLKQGKNGKRDLPEVRARGVAGGGGGGAGREHFFKFPFEILAAEPEAQSTWPDHKLPHPALCCLWRI